MYAASLHEAVTTSSDSSVTIEKASQCVCSQENPKHFQRNHVVAMCNTENPNHRCMQLHFTKLLQQALVVLSKRAVSATLYI
jgi:hypothetical protein